MKFHNLKAWGYEKAPSAYMDFHGSARHQLFIKHCIAACLHLRIYQVSQVQKKKKKKKTGFYIKYSVSSTLFSVGKKSYNTNETNHIAVQ